MRRNTRKHLEEAADLLWREYTEAIENAEPKAPSDAFDEKMIRLIRERARQREEQQKIGQTARRKTIRRRLITAAVIVIAALAGWLLLDKTAYAKISKWFKSLLGNRVSYSFSDDFRDDGLSVVRLGWIPEGSEILKEETNGTTKEYEILLCFEDGTLLQFQYGFMYEGLVFGFEDVSEQALNIQQITVGDYTIECYLNVDSIENDYVWMDEERNMYFCLTSYLPHEICLKILEHIEYWKEE
ncbi:MAG: DUF4367 domain-containing protein [Lachnospiraceae bacterium]|nr:DUF4367 domain-containing protein [Lachnospiraceae bacterium]